ncbi:BPSL0761 family protein [Pseudomonas thivervalensis]|uniref:BPSL0761 family protein n=1 Tax=Pseudomonas thivervalensis TaxID=86265 RepID=UPI003D95C4A5
MTMPFERTRSVAQTHAFLTELACDTEVPERIRQNARFLLRHFPTKNEVLLAGRIEEEAKN